MDISAARKAPYWWDAIDAEASRPQLPGDIDVDVAIVGAGFTGLWCAYYLRKLDPDLRIAVLEKTHVGFGASGRNGGWCHAEYPLGQAQLRRGPRERCGDAAHASAVRKRRCHRSDSSG